MGQYTLLMNNATKQLVCTQKISLRQHESLVDKIVFVVPFMYTEEIDLRDFSVVMEWLDPTGIAHMDILEKEEEIYKEKYQRYFLPIESPINRYAGDVELKLVFTYADSSTKKRYKLETRTTMLTIESIKDYYAVMPNESFDALNDKIDELKALADQINASAEIYNAIKADNHRINEDGDLVLTSGGVDIGTPVSVVTPGTIDDIDQSHDGVINLDDVYNL